MNKNIALLALTGVLTLASCNPGVTPTCTADQTLQNGICVATNPVTTGSATT